MRTQASTPQPTTVVGWASVWIRAIARSWRLRAHHIGSNIP